MPLSAAMTHTYRTAATPAFYINYMLKKFVFLFLSLLSLFTPQAQRASLRLGVLKGNGCLPCAYLIENKEKLSVQNMAFELFDSAESELPRLLRGQIDACFLAPENAAKAFEKTKAQIVCLAVVQNGTLSLLTNDEAYGSISDLQEKTILCPSSSENETLVFKSLLEKTQALKEKGFPYLDFSVPTSSIANSLITKKATYAILPEPYATVAVRSSNEVRKAESIQKLYNESNEWFSYPALLLVARSDFVKQNKELVRRFIEAYKNANQWTVKNSAKAALISEKHKITLSSAVTKDSLSSSGLVFKEAGSAKGELEKYLNILIEQKSASAPAFLPTEEFYF